MSDVLSREALGQQVERLETIIEGLRADRGDVEMVPAESVRVIDIAELARQHERAWPDFHPETFCHRCGCRNVRSWFIDSDEWNLATERPDILCPQCLTESWAKVTGQKVTWELSVDPATRGEVK